MGPNIGGFKGNILDDRIENADLADKTEEIAKDKVDKSEANIRIEAPAEVEDGLSDARKRESVIFNEHYRGYILKRHERIVEKLDSILSVKSIELRQLLLDLAERKLKLSTLSFNVVPNDNLAALSGVEARDLFEIVAEDMTLLGTNSVDQHDYIPSGHDLIVKTGYKSISEEDYDHLSEADKLLYRNCYVAGGKYIKRQDILCIRPYEKTKREIPNWASFEGEIYPRVQADYFNSLGINIGTDDLSDYPELTARGEENIAAIIEREYQIRKADKSLEDDVLAESFGLFEKDIFQRFKYASGWTAYGRLVEVNRSGEVAISCPQYNPSSQFVYDTMIKMLDPATLSPNTLESMNIKYEERRRSADTE